jgi:hypothetical protein
MDNRVRAAKTRGGWAERSPGGNDREEGVTQSPFSALLQKKRFPAT